ncbi:MAG: hypothetical protein CVU57_16110 [Deltaproteobacteria bacterium HGW-Deltaproteobacteria-15]|jgi:hypothetical protein|nr:MAG: hypothetical protein CVU57_16110 [Deltaproteobacteria bacterium HGW-Deltaproteobacteria-15]
MQEKEESFSIFEEGQIIGECSNPTHVDYKGCDVDVRTFEYKGCWNCEYFTYTQPVVTVQKAAQLWGISTHTIYRFIKKDKLKAKLFEKQRFHDKYGNVVIQGSNKIWLIEDDSIQKKK